MSNPTLSITSISSENNYLKIEGTITESGEETGRSMVSYYPKKSTTFNIQEESEEGKKGTEYKNIFTISNHMGVGTINIPENSIGLVKQGAKGESFTSATFTAFMTENTGI